jgi:hypothetical protein
MMSMKKWLIEECSWFFVCILDQLSLDTVDQVADTFHTGLVDVLWPDRYSFRCLYCLNLLDDELE